MSDEMLSLYDETVERLSASYPHLSDAEIVVRTLKLSLQALFMNLVEYGQTGEALSNDMLFNLCSNLDATLVWLIAKDEMAVLWADGIAPCDIDPPSAGYL